WIIAENEDRTALGFVSKEADRHGDLPITIEISKALIVYYSPSSTGTGPIQVL
ncbi:hypothetical protein FS837_006499, partial [Tulasnella sp. UAMH 9824]